jgi:hypothetical protein
MPDLSKISFKEMLNGPTGKSSLSLLLCFIWGILSVIMMITAIISGFMGLAFYSEVFTYGGLVLGASASLLGVRRITDKNQILEIEKEDKQEKI